MSGPVPPVKPAPAARPVRRRLQMLALRRRLEEHAGGAPEEPPAAPAATPTAGHPEPGVAAQLLGERERRGLRAGYNIREEARATYLQTEYAGPHDRRPRKGRITKTEV